MSDLTNLSLPQAYGDFLNLNKPEAPGQGFTLSLTAVTDGLGNLCPLQLSLTSVNVSTAGGFTFQINGTELTAPAEKINLVCDEVVPDFSFAVAIQLGEGTTAERPEFPEEGMMRWNTELNVFEGYDGVSWKQFTLV